MPRRVSLPAADELFRTTGGAAVQPSTPHEHAADASQEEAAAARQQGPAPGGDQAAGGDPEDGPRPHTSGTAEAAPASSGNSREPSVPGQSKRGPAAGARAGGAKGRAAAAGQQQAAAQRAGGRAGRMARRPSGRERHDEKITVYVSAEELMDLEQARLVLRGEHGLAVDRGRIVREAVAVVLADLESRGEASILVRRLRAS
ncbi:hypothetical protein [Streptomyces aidingensis]|uniref:Cobyrinic acid a,c-diamide synthase n=1 Tax=Streptomyces aidingensis TaxID=910347 RepID=A0A1I1UHZ0_9ACTN|nr:hypothetical protein [Streptomyces aidingensis]SFD67550.1 hypothetical protein SAMN05421773_12360 [Streptomyces aidingensis]